jgi:hypothetical protein
MERKTMACCCHCRQPILPGEDSARFKVPGEGIYQCFHRRFNAGDCWGKRLSGLML